MSDITNKELAFELICLPGEDNLTFHMFDSQRDTLRLASKRLAQYPDMHHTEATNFRDLASKFLKMRDDRDRLQSIIDSMIDQRSKLHSRFKDRKGQENPEAEFMAPNDPVERLAAMPDAGERYERLRSAAESWGHQTGLWNTSHSEHAGETVRAANKLISALEEDRDPAPAPDKEAIKRYCLEFVSASFGYQEEYLPELWDTWWKKQSAEGGE